MAKVDRLFIGRYNDIYGSLLQDGVSEMLRLYYDRDMTLQEIAELYGVTRQAVSDSISRAEKQLAHYEEALKLSSIYGMLEEWRREADSIGDKDTAQRIETIKARIIE